jgi:hypothetical protein
MEQSTLKKLINNFSHIRGSKDFILLSYVSLQDLAKSKNTKRFIESILKQECFANGIGISNEEISNMIKHWLSVVRSKKNKGENYSREKFTLKALTIILSNTQ